MIGQISKPLRRKYIGFIWKFEEKYSNGAVQFLANVPINYDAEYKSEVGRVFSVVATEILRQSTEDSTSRTNWHSAIVLSRRKI